MKDLNAMKAKKESKTNRILLMISAMAFSILSIPLETQRALITICVVGVLCFLVIKRDTFFLDVLANIRGDSKRILIAAIIALVCAGMFYDNWIDSSKVAAIAKTLRMPVPLLVIAAAIGLAIASTGFLVSALEMLKQDGNTVETVEISQRKVIAICTLTAVGVITVCSKSSFLYPLNDWVDANCFFTVGKSMMNGVVMYRDLWEQKGPFLYFLHALAWLISNDTFFGVYLIEIAACAFFLYFSYKTAGLYAKNSLCLLMVPLVAALIYVSPAFCHGDSAEELSLPFLAYALWVSMQAFVNNEELTLKEYLIVGIGAGLVFWTKFTMVGFYIGWFVMPALQLIQKKQWKRLGQVIGVIASGVLISTVPFIIYFGMNHAILDWLEVYIYDNLFLYTLNEAEVANSGLIANLLSGLKFVCKRGLSLLLFSLLGGIWFAICTERKTAAHYFLMLFFTFAVTFVGGRQYDYYPFVLAIFVPYGMVTLIRVLTESFASIQRGAKQNYVAYVLVLLCTAAALLTTPNRYLMGVKKEELPQYQFKEIIEQKENPTLLNYGFLDGGFYTVCEIVPNCKAFAQLNIPLEEMSQMQRSYVENGLCDFVVTRELELEYAHYECVAQSEFRNKEGKIFTYYLYQLKL